MEKQAGREKLSEKLQFLSTYILSKVLNWGTHPLALTLYGQYCFPQKKSDLLTRGYISCHEYPNQIWKFSSVCPQNPRCQMSEPFIAMLKIRICRTGLIECSWWENTYNEKPSNALLTVPVRRIEVMNGVGVGRSGPFCSESDSEVESIKFGRLWLQSGIAASCRLLRLCQSR